MRSKASFLTAWVALLGIQLCVASAKGQQTHPSDEHGNIDTVSVQILHVSDSYWVATVALTNDENLAAMTLPFRWYPQPGHFRLDSASYGGLRTDYFALKTFYPDTVAGTILIGLISNLGTGRPPLEPGKGPIARLHFTSLDSATESLGIDTVFIRPHNVLQLVTPDVRSILPAFRSHPADSADGEGSQAPFADPKNQ